MVPVASTGGGDEEIRGDANSSKESPTPFYWQSMTASKDHRTFVKASRTVLGRTAARNNILGKSIRRFGVSGSGMCMGGYTVGRLIDRVRNSGTAA